MKQPSIESIRRRLTPLLKKKGVEKAIVFGSSARKTRTRKSDLDLVIILETKKRFFNRYDEFKEIHDLIKGNIDLLIYTPKEFQAISHRKFIKKILSEGKIIYEH
ncbi:MAG: nucleotidyltransferase domain-containing protein [Promethearchaeota archaeon]